MAEPVGTIPAAGAAGGTGHGAEEEPALPGRAPDGTGLRAGPERGSSALGRLRVRLRRLFYGHRPAAIRFQVGLLALDLAAVAYFLATTFVHDAPWLRAVDLLLGVLLAFEFLGRMLAHRHPMHYLDNGAALVDLAVVASLFVSALGGNLGFLRVLRTVRLLRSYNVLGQLKKRVPAVRRNEEVILAALNFAVFILMISALVYVTQRGANEKIVDFVDALYFTVAALSTTGFGDVTLIGSTFGELLSVAMMVVGITLFLRLAQAASRFRAARWDGRIGSGPAIDYLSRRAGRPSPCRSSRPRRHRGGGHDGRDRRRRERTASERASVAECVLGG